ncbi:hypothetical protein OED52_13660 [Rhodococcus sp. Z13]|uniref:Uncharacterized protein n=1 Tax=Rhodococcus sacchari TaxID=2962047 RepID=A0ACD4DCL5_9NOCA|nr:hypothetical protein [Rhodococcus sp. Z13]UYP17718.1 hypothetical protein OED52_13660 [Rhodococcus sp. Z13]
MSVDVQQLMMSALRKRSAQGGKHLHHRDCIHNLPPEEQIAIRGKTVEWWMAVVGSMPEQITPDQWETDGLESAS